MQELSGSIVFTRESLDRMLADPNSHLYVIREESRIVACACLCIFHQPFSTDATIESVVVSSKMRGKGLGRKLMELLIGEASRMKVDCIHLTSNPSRVAALAVDGLQKLYESDPGLELCEDKALVEEATSPPNPSPV